MNGDVVLGIDLGTTNSVVAVADGGQARVLSNEMGERLIPSVVSFKGDGGVLIGDEARDRRLLDAKNTIYSVKRLIGRPYRTPEVRTAQERFAFDIAESPSGGVIVNIRKDSYTLTEISSFVLREVARIAERALGFSVSRSVVTVPANFNELQRSATKAAGRVAGLDVVRIINEPTAAALAYGYGKTKPERVAVYDLGGGTFDLTILELENDVFEVVSTAGDSFLGGDDIDILVADMMCDAFLEQHRWDPRTDRQAYERLRAASEWAKCQLSDEDVVELTIEELHYGAGGKPLDLEFHLERDELEKAVLPYIARSFDVCQHAFSDAKMKPKDVDSIVLVGGSTRVPLVRKMVEEYFGRSPRAEIDPDLVVAQGAAIHGYAIGGFARKKRPALGRVALKKISAADLKRLKEKRAKRQEALPNQPAFAPNAQVEDSRPPAKKPARPTGPPQRLPDLPSPRRPPPPRASFDDQPTRIGASFDDQPTQIGASPLAEEPTTIHRPNPDTVPGTDLDNQPTSISVRPPAIPGVVTAAAPIPIGKPVRDLDAELADYLGKSASQPQAVPLAPEPIPLSAKAKPRRRPPPPTPAMPGVVVQPPPIMPPRTQEMPTAPPPAAPAKRPEKTTVQPPALDAPMQPPARPAPPPIQPPMQPPIQQAFDKTAPMQQPPVMQAPPPPAQPAPPPAPQAAPRPAPPRLDQTGPMHALPGMDDEFRPSFGPEPSDMFDVSAPLSVGAGSVAQKTAPIPVVELPDRAPPLLMDVTPHSLGIETAGGYCQQLIRRNAPIPAEQSRVFTTASDGQQVVVVRVSQGEERVFGENQALGEIMLSGLRDAPRGEVQIDVAFILDASGTLDVRAVDVATGREQSIRINLLGGASDADIDAMRERQSRLLA